MDVIGPLIQTRFWDRVNRRGSIPPHRPELGPCWEWTAGCFQDGYGSMRIPGVGSRRAHRIAFYLAEGRWPEPQALHHCDNRLCVRRSHLFEGTPADNVHDCVVKGRARGGNHPGERTHTAKLRDWDIPVIRASAGYAKDVAAAFGVSDETIYAIRNGKSWTHIPGSIV